MRHEILKCDDSIKSNQAVLSSAAVHYAVEGCSNCDDSNETTQCYYHVVLLIIIAAAGQYYHEVLFMMLHSAAPEGTV